MFFCADGETAIFKVATVISLEELFLWGHKDFTITATPRSCATGTERQLGGCRVTAIIGLPDAVG